LSGIGAGKAAAIVAYRDENGAFTSVDELIEVKGIGKALLDKNREKLALD
jgi:competence protein ComEA